MKRLALLATLLVAAALCFAAVGFGGDDRPANGEKRQLDPPDDGLNGPVSSTTSIIVDGETGAVTCTTTGAKTTGTVTAYGKALICRHAATSLPRAG